jgi:hypothetical protein
MLLKGTERSIELFLQFLKSASQSKSLLTGQTVFTKEIYQTIKAKYIDNPLEDKRSFDEKIQEQLGKERANVKDLFANALWLYYLVSVDSISKETKKKKLQDWVGNITESLIDEGCINTGPSHNTHKDNEIRLICRFIEKIIDNPQFTKNTNDLENTVRESVGKDRKEAMKNVLLYLINPEKYEPIASYDVKERIVKRWKNYVANTSDIDEALFKIRKKLEKDDYSKGFNFYDTKLRDEWDNGLKYWVFRFNPENPDIEWDENNIVPGEENYWLKPPSRSKAHKGDRVFIWKNHKEANERGIYGIGEISSDGSYREEDENRIDVKYLKRLVKYISQNELTKDFPEIVTQINKGEADKKEIEPSLGSILWNQINGGKIEYKNIPDKSPQKTLRIETESKKKIEDTEEYYANMTDFDESAPATKITVTTSARVRKPEVREFVRFRANGICELCDQKAPFNNPKGEPFLEVHHIDYLCDDGHDSPDNAAALCPNCHRKMHILNDSKDVKKLKKKAKTGN